MTHMIEDKPALPTQATPPLDNSLAKIRALGEWYAVSAGPIRDSAGWTWDSAYACNDFAAFQPKLDAAIISSGLADKRIHGYGLFSGYAWLIVTSALACYLLDRRLPNLSPDGIAFRTTQHKSGEALTELRYVQPRFFCLPSDAEAAHVDATVVADEAALLALFHEQIEQVLPPVMQVIQANTGHIGRAMWAQASDWVIGAVIEYVRLTGRRDELDGLVQQLAKREGSPLKMRNGAIELRFDDLVTGETCSEPMLDRASCCQWYRYPEAKGERCSTCPGIPRAKRVEKMTAYYREARAKQHATHKTSNV